MRNVQVKDVGDKEAAKEMIYEGKWQMTALQVVVTTLL